MSVVIEDGQVATVHQSRDRRQINSIGIEHRRVMIDSDVIPLARRIGSTKVSDMQRAVARGKFVKNLRLIGRRDIG